MGGSSREREEERVRADGVDEDGGAGLIANLERAGRRWAGLGRAEMMRRGKNGGKDTLILQETEKAERPEA